ncbi:ABC transporter substrate-binding protein [Cyanobacterium aponinum UTEX 3222]|uniref:ABC transporter substrate-binding protein n=1 Tax=Cyanobacterium aponinum AL20115 TaxID=3090662 RepID=A0AAF0Z9H0_9CHRO|nr:ABC transporter substrate-binding protein [Cyanobacterium aponinum]WPF88011.1 ABC transporter substrate-binding protein [Cyanobacterium aponinum AL20115]WRL37118.1 ABC transporter substrate-binding protein [Cyanobacterium aponinum UTEX 3221]WRL43464.1 ABC transporter substrate-binding protein [Cyanobacterium aponinum UTEX 3222]
MLINVVYSAEKTTITLMIQALEAAQWQNLVEKFERENPDIDLEIISAPNATNLVEDLYTSAFLLGDSPYDLVYLDIVWVQKFAAANWLKPLNNFISEDELKQFLKGDVEGGKYQDSLYRIPFRSDGGMLYYRTDLLEKNGYNPPETFTELINISQDLQAKGKAKWGYVWQGRQYEGLSAMFVEVLQGFGGYWINSDTLEVGLDSPEAIASVQFLLDTIKKGISPSGVTTYAEEETRRIFENGQTVFLRNWPYVAGLASKSEIAGKFSLKPMVHQPQHQSGACQGGWGLGMSKNTKHPEEAWRVIEFITSEDSQRDFILETGYVPSRKSLFNDPQIVEKYPYYPQLLTVVENSVLRPPIAQYAQASDILQRYLSAALTQTMTPENAMKKAATETRQLLN